MNINFCISASIFRKKTIFPLKSRDRFFYFLFVVDFIKYQVEHHKLVGVNAEVLQVAHNLRYKYFPVFRDFWYKPTV